MSKNYLNQRNKVEDFLFKSKFDYENQPINRLVKFQFQKMFLEDKLFTALPNVTSWLATNFNQLNRYAEKTHEKK